MAAIACAPPALKMRSTPAMCAAARMAALTLPSRPQGVQRMISAQPASLAGTTSIITVEGEGGHIQARALDRQHLLPHHDAAGAREEKAVPKLLFVIFPDVALRQTERIEKFRLGRGQGLADLLRRDQHGLEPDAVEFLGIAKHRLVAVLAHILEDGGDDPGHVGLRFVSFQKLGIVELSVPINADHFCASSARPRTTAPIASL